MWWSALGQAHSTVEWGIVVCSFLHWGHSRQSRKPPGLSSPCEGGWWGLGEARSTPTLSYKGSPWGARATHAMMAWHISQAWCCSLHSSACRQGGQEADQSLTSILEAPQGGFSVRQKWCPPAAPVGLWSKPRWRSHNPPVDRPPKDWKSCSDYQLQATPISGGSPRAWRQNWVSCVVR